MKKSKLLSTIVALILAHSSASAWDMDNNDPRGDGETGGWSSGAFSGDTSTNDQGFNNAGGWTQGQQDGYLSAGGTIDVGSRDSIGMGSNFGGSHSGVAGYSGYLSIGIDTSSNPDSDYDSALSATAVVAEMADRAMTKQGVPQNERSSIMSLALQTYSEEVEGILDAANTALSDTTGLTGPEVGMISSQNDGLLGFIAHDIEGFVDAVREFSGKLGAEQIDISKYKVAPKSNKLIKRLVKSLRESNLLEPISKLGLRGVRIAIYSDLPSSFYSKKLDVVFLAKKDVDKYGPAVLFHEILHAGLEKGRKLSLLGGGDWYYKKLGKLNESHFSHLNGYVGTCRGLYKRGGFCYQEAFVIGFSFLRIHQQAGSIKDTEMKRRAINYRNAVQNNHWLRKLSNGLSLRMITSKKLTQSQVRTTFLNQFLVHTSGVRKIISGAQHRVNQGLPSVCAPGKVKILEARQCGSQQVKYEKQFDYTIRQCGDNYKWGKVEKLGCGRVVWEKETGM